MFHFLSTPDILAVVEIHFCALKCSENCKLNVNIIAKLMQKLIFLENDSW